MKSTLIKIISKLVVVLVILWAIGYLPATNREPALATLENFIIQTP